MSNAIPAMAMRLGVAPSSCRVLGLLPLVAVAWADGEVQGGERSHILDLAGELGGLDADAVMLLEDWLRHAPSPTYVQQGIDLLVQMIHARHPVLDAALLDRIPAEAEKVAEAAGGGLFGLFGKVSQEERDAIAWLRKTLQAARAAVTDGERTDPGASRRQALTMLGGDHEEDDVIGVFIVEGPPRRKMRVPDGGVVVGSGPQTTLQIAGLPATAMRVYAKRRRFYIEALDARAPVTVHGERVGHRRLFGGEALEVGGVSFGFKLASPTG